MLYLVGSEKISKENLVCKSSWKKIIYMHIGNFDCHITRFLILGIMETDQSMLFTLSVIEEQ